MASDLEIKLRRGIGFVSVRPRGVLSFRTVATLRRTLSKILAEYHRVLVDLTELTAPRMLLLVFVVTLAASGGWPGSRMTIFVTDPTTRSDLSAIRVAQLIPVCETFHSAVLALDQRPAVVRRSTELLGEPAVPVLAHGFATETCHDWRISGHARAAAVGAASELGGYAIQSGAKLLRLTLELKERMVTISIRYWSVDTGTDDTGTDLAEDYRETMAIRYSGHTGTARHGDGRTTWLSVPLS